MEKTEGRKPDYEFYHHTPFHDPISLLAGSDIDKTLFYLYGNGALSRGLYFRKIQRRRISAFLITRMAKYYRRYSTHYYYLYENKPSGQSPFLKRQYCPGDQVRSYFVP